ncbi:MAG TPA: ribosome maturation factor RimP [Labilithrix sp.]|nr:ribosome maturation factor RimP [Labilithrix sp.]
MIDRARLQAVIDPVVSAHGAELCDFELKNENGWVLRIYVERLGSLEKKLSTKEAAIDLEICSHIARDLSPALDLADPIPHRYHLEVGSPGVERPLRKPADFARFVGEKAKLKLRTGVAGQKVLVGKLASVEGPTLTLEDGAKSFAIPLDDVVSAHLVFEFGPAARPGRPGANSHATKSPKKKRKA